MPRVDEQVRPEEAARLTDRQDRALHSGLDRTQEQARSGLDRLVEVLGGASDVDPTRLQELSERMTQRLDAFDHDMERIDFSSVDRDLARDLARALSDGGDLDAFAERLDARSEDVRTTAESSIEPDLPDQEFAQRQVEREEARQDLSAYEQVREATEMVRELKSIAQELEDISRELQTAMTAEEATRQLQRIVDKAEDLANEKERKLRISQEMTGGEIEF
ncbi:MAG: hypothetical protein KDC14_16755 [Planctomycetes bacterium]|nr:hypothetical protein [Planctomycetota bacterium]